MRISQRILVEWEQLSLETVEKWLKYDFVIGLLVRLVYKKGEEREKDKNNNNDRIFFHRYNMFIVH